MRERDEMLKMKARSLISSQSQSQTYRKPFLNSLETCLIAYENLVNNPQKPKPKILYKRGFMTSWETLAVGQRSEKIHHRSTGRSTDVQTKTNPGVKNKKFPEKITYGRQLLLPTVDRDVDSVVDRCVKNTDMHSSLEIL